MLSTFPLTTGGLKALSGSPPMLLAYAEAWLPPMRGAGACNEFIIAKPCPNFIWLTIGLAFRPLRLLNRTPLSGPLDGGSRFVGSLATPLSGVRTGNCWFDLNLPSYGSVLPSPITADLYAGG